MANQRAEYILSILGARGSHPVSGSDFLRYGGATTCFRVETPKETIILDAGTGICQAAVTGKPISLLLTHLHLDHVSGLPTFLSALPDAVDLKIHAASAILDGWQQKLATLLSPPFWPHVGVRPLPDLLMDLPGSGECLTLGDACVRTCPVPHPQPCTAIRIDTPAGAVCLATDLELDPDALPADLVNLCRGAETLIVDAHFLPSELAKARGWGHSSWVGAVALAEAVAAQRLILTHHAPTRTDAGIDAIIASARQRFPQTWAATEGETFDISRKGSPHREPNAR